MSFVIISSVPASEGARLSAVKLEAIDHGGGALAQAACQAAEVAQVGLGRDVARQRVGIACAARATNYLTSFLHIKFPADKENRLSSHVCTATCCCSPALGYRAHRYQDTTTSN